MFVSELETFVKKFHQLWSAGHSAHLDIDSHAGRAWVGLRVVSSLVMPQVFIITKFGQHLFQSIRRKTVLLDSVAVKGGQLLAKESETISTPEKVVVDELSQTSTENDNTENEATIQVEEEDKEAEEASIKNVENQDEKISL